MPLLEKGGILGNTPATAAYLSQQRTCRTKICQQPRWEKLDFECTFVAYEADYLRTCYCSEVRGVIVHSHVVRSHAVASGWRLAWG